MFSEKDFERLWFLYKTEGEPNGVSINSFCIGNNIPYPKIGSLPNCLNSIFYTSQLRNLIIVSVHFSPRLIKK